MTRLWRFLEFVLREAKPPSYYKDKLLQHVTLHYGEHEADLVAADMQRMSPQSFQQHVATRYVDPKLDQLVSSMVDGAIAANPRLAGKGSAKDFPQYPTSTSSSDKGSGNAEPIPQRPDRRDVDSPLYGKPSHRVSPGEKPVHAVGSAGTGVVKQQPSLATGITPQKLDPKASRSGMVHAQREVDRLFKSGKRREADELARKLGVPTSQERTNADGKISVWHPDRVMKFFDQDRNPDAPAVQKRALTPDDRVNFIKHGIMKRLAAGDVKPNFPGKFVGQVWQPHGQSFMTSTSYNNPATGRQAYGRRLVDPSKTGNAMVWDGEDWVPKEKFDSSHDVAKRAWKASQNPPTRGSHVGGKTVSTTSPESIPLRARPQSSKPSPDAGWIDTGLSQEQGATSIKARYIPDENQTKVSFRGSHQNTEPAFLHGRVSPEQALKWYLSQFSDSDGDDDFESEEDTDPDLAPHSGE